MTDKCRISNFRALVQVSHTLDDTKTEGKHFTSFMLVQTYPLRFTAHLFAGYGVTVAVFLFGTYFFHGCNLCRNGCYGPRNVCANHADELWPGQLEVIFFTVYSHFSCTLESHVVYNWNFIVVVLKRASEGKKKSDFHFFFRVSGGNQPTGVRSGILILAPPWLSRRASL
jgi:hypothetical protein